jgi:demethylmenaquinone methyltransferase/2-methoxy-6-polyprenyl-1,4-benzoquinol methylase
MESARKREALELFRGLPRRYDRLSAALSFWQDPRWRRALVDAMAPQAGERILDVATGTGMVAAELRARADCSVVGLDQSPQMLAAARARFAGEGARVELV